MATEFNTAGYEDLRIYMRDNWNWIAILDDADNEWLRWDINSNANITITSDPTGNPLTVEITVTGVDLTDAGASYPVTINETEVYKGSGTSTIMGTDTHTDATFNADGDEVTLTHNYRAPQ